MCKHGIGVWTEEKTGRGKDQGRRESFLHIVNIRGLERLPAIGSISCKGYIANLVYIHQQETHRSGECTFLTTQLFFSIHYLAKFLETRLQRLKMLMKFGS